MWYTHVCSCVCAAMLNMCVHVLYVYVEATGQSQVLPLSTSTLFFERTTGIVHHTKVFPWIPEI